MNFLYPLFLAGVAAIGIPIVLHMVRRKTKKRVTFSSLMFVPAAAPLLRNRSRVENVFLLILRCAIIGLLAFAFSRPFFARPVSNQAVRPAKRIVLLLDTSASMRRTGLWEQATAEARAALQNAGRADSVCIMSFDRETRVVMGFEQWDQLEPGQRVAAAAEQVSKLAPSWAQTNLAAALVAAAEAIEDDEINDAGQTVTARRIVLISDLQEGSELEGLGGYEWPKQTDLVVRQVRAGAATNAALQLITDRADLMGSDAENRPRIRIMNSSDASAEQFQINWADDAAARPGGPNEPANVYVAPGRSVVIRAPAPRGGQPSRSLILSGDDHDFDNTLYVAPSVQQPVNCLYIGSDDPNDSKEMLFYVRQAFGATGTLAPRVVWRQGDSDIAAADVAAADLIFVTDTVGRQNIAVLRRGVESGRTLLLVVKSVEAAETLAGLAQIEKVRVEEAEVDRYAMLSRIEFAHPLFMPFSEPLFGDFTQIHFWKYRRINAGDLPDARVPAWFDTDDPALLELRVGKGSLLVMSSGWGRADSQLALSSKFVPLLYSLLEYGGVHTTGQLQYFIGDSVPVTRSATDESVNVRIRKPDGSVVGIEAAEQTFTQTDQPGIYTIESDGGPSTAGLFAVNLSARECRTAPMPIEDLENLGVVLDQGGDVHIEKVEKARRHGNLAEMEYEQKLWRRLLAALLAVALMETALAGRLTGSVPKMAGPWLNQ